jgi:hypothetical protein
MDDFWLRLAVVSVAGVAMLTGLWGVFRTMRIRGRVLSRGAKKASL